MIRSHEELDVYQMAFVAAMRIFEVSKKFPRQETYALIDQMRRSSRSVCSNIAEAWRKRRYEAAFVSKLNDAETEAAALRLRSGWFPKTQTWLRFAIECQYLAPEMGAELHQTFDHINGKLVNMIANPSPWILRRSSQ